MFFGKVKYMNTPAEFELVTFRLEVRHNMKMSQITLKSWRKWIENFYVNRTFSIDFFFILSPLLKWVAYVFNNVVFIFRVISRQHSVWITFYMNH